MHSAANRFKSGSRPCPMMHCALLQRKILHVTAPRQRFARLSLASAFHPIDGSDVLFQSMKRQENQRHAIAGERKKRLCGCGERRIFRRSRPIFRRLKSVEELSWKKFFDKRYLPQSTCATWADSGTPTAEPAASDLRGGFCSPPQLLPGLIGSILTLGGRKNGKW